MSDGILSQKEIDALLGDSLPSDGDEIDLDAIGYVLTRVLEPWVMTVSNVWQQPGSVELQTILYDSFDVLAYQAGPSVFVKGQLTGELSGELYFLVPADVVKQFSAEGTGEEHQTDGLTEATIESFADQLERARLEMATALTNIVGTPIKLEFSSAVEVNWEGDVSSVGGLPLGQEVFQATYAVNLGSLNADWFLYMPREVAMKVNSIIGQADDLQQGFEDEALQLGTDSSEPAEKSKANVQEASFQELGTPSPAAEHGNLDFLLDVPLQVTVELGRTRMQIREVLDLGKGSVVELEKLAGEPVEVFVNGKLIAKGEVVTIDENFGVKITEIVSKAERVHTLQ